MEEEKIQLTCFDKNNKEHIIKLKEMIKDEEILKRFQGFLPKLNKESKDIFDKGFYVSLNNEIVGYMDISNYHQDEDCIYLRAAIFEEYRNKHLGTKMLNDTCEYIFTNYPFINKIKLKIAEDNIPSQKIAGNCGFKYEAPDYYYLENPNYIKSNSLH